MALHELQVLPLCIPDNFKFDGRDLLPDGHTSRKDLVICPQGLKLLQNINDPVIVICITGPARSGKSFFLSHLLDGIQFSLGHTTKSHTTGIWIAASPTLVKRGGQQARIILLDAEGTGALKTVDNGAGPQWDTKVFSLCSLISSVLIYNTNQPTRDDIQKLGFIAKFSDSIRKNSQGEKDKEAGKKFKSCAPTFMWLIRNALLETSDDDSSDEDNEDGDSTQDWNKYMTEEVLCIKKGSSDEEKNVNAIIKAIKKTFPSIQAVGIPPPSSDRKVCKNLHDPMMKTNKDVAIFLQKIKQVATQIVNEAKIKKLNDKVMTGSELAVFIEHFVQAVNSEANMLPWENIYDTAVKSSLQKFLQSALTKYESLTEGITLPCKTEELDQALKKAIDQAKEQFTTQTKFTDATLKQRYESQLTEQLKSKSGRIVEENNYKSKEFCRTQIANLKRDIFNKLKETENILTYSEVVKALNHIYEEYQKNTSGYPNADEVKYESERTLSDDSKILGQNIIKKQQKDIVAEYTKNFNTYRENLPCAENSLQEFYEETKLALICRLKENIEGCSKEENEMCIEEVEEKFNEIFQATKAVNEKISTEKCDRIIDRLKSDHLIPVVSGFPDISYSSLLDAKAKIIREIEETPDLGPSVTNKKEILERDITSQFQQFMKPIVENAYHKALDLYTSKMKITRKIEPCVEEEELQVSHNGAYSVSKQKFEELTEGCKSTLVETKQKTLDEKTTEQFSELQLENAQRSSVFCERLMKSLIDEHIKSLENSGSLVDDTSASKDLVLAQYDKRAKGPRAQSVKESYEHSIDTEIQKVKSKISSNRTEAIIHGVGAIAGVAAGGMGAISSTVASKSFHFVKGAATAMYAAAPAVANAIKGIGTNSTDTNLPDLVSEATLNKFGKNENDNNDNSNPIVSSKDNDNSKDNPAFDIPRSSGIDDKDKDKDNDYDNKDDSDK